MECGPCQENESCIDHLCMCEPQECTGERCDDGCGGPCPCRDGTECNANNECVEICDDTCDSVGWICGEVCGDDCGSCEADEACLEGFCFPSTLRMSVQDPQTIDGITRAMLLVDYEPRTGEPRPRMADLRIKPNTDLNLSVRSVTAGPAMQNKSFYTDPDSGDSWRIRSDGSIQLLIYSTTNTSSFDTGHLLWIELEFEIPASADSASFSLIRRDQTFAPFEADLALQESAYELPVVVTK